MYKANQNGACSITMLGDVKGRTSDRDFPNEEIGHILDMSTELMTDHQSLRQYLYCFLTDAYRFQFFKCEKIGDSFRFHSSPLYFGEKGWQIFFQLRALNPEQLGLVMDEVEGWSIINGLGTGRFSRVYEVKSKNNQNPSSYVLKYFNNLSQNMGRHEEGILRAMQAESENVPQVYCLIETIQYSALVVSPVGIPIISAAQNYIINSNMIITLLNVLSYAHKMSIIHRDVKPENIFLDKNDPNKIILNDWGSAATENISCPYQGTPVYGQQHIQGQLQVPTRQLDLHCLVKTVYTIKQQRFPPSESEWINIEAYWNGVARNFPKFQTILNFADEGNYNELRSYFERMWY